MKKIAVLCSGGDSPGMNACIRAVVRTAVYYNLEAWGVYRGYAGMIDGDLRKMASSDVSNIIQRGGTILYSARSKAFRTKEGRKKAYDNLKKHEIDGLVVIGGDGSFRGAQIFGDEFDFPILGCPGTIDNDLYGTDITIGYDTALNTALDAIDRIKDTAASHCRLFFIEVMGRDVGYIALNCGIAGGAESVLIPETMTDIDDLVKQLQKVKDIKKKSAIVIVAEGDDAGGAQEIAEKVNEKFDYLETRVSILGHMQRGGVPSCRDRVVSSRMGVAAVEGLLKGERAVMTGLQHRDIRYVPFKQAVKHTRKMNPEVMRVAEVLAHH